MAELPVPCTLTEPALAARRAGVLAAVRRDQQEARWLPDGPALRFAAEPDRPGDPGRFCRAGAPVLCFPAVPAHG